MENKKPISHVVAGLLIAGLVIALSLVMMLINGGTQRPEGGWITYLIIIGGLMFFINQWGKAHNNTLSFGNLFSYGFKATAVYTILFIVFLILFTLVSPDFKTQAMDAARTEMEKQKNVTEEQIEQSLAMVEKYFWVFAIGGTMLGFIVMGAIGSLLGAAITKKRPANPFEQQIP